MADQIPTPKDYQIARRLCPTLDFAPSVHESEESTNLTLGGGCPQCLKTAKAVAEVRKAGTDVTFITITGGGHGGFRSEELTGRVHRYFDKHLRGKDAKISAEAIPQGQGNRRR